MNTFRIRTAAPALIAALCFVATVAGCQSRGRAAESRSAGLNGVAASHSGSRQLTVVALPDPAFGGMPATFVAVPKGWHAQGQMITNQCVNVAPFAAWNATSQDGREEQRELQGRD